MNASNRAIGVANQPRPPKLEEERKLSLGPGPTSSLATSILIIDPNASRRTELCSVLGASVAQAASIAAAIPLLSQRPHVVISCGNNPHQVLRALAQVPPSHVCIFVSQDPDELIDVAGEGHPFVAVRGSTPETIREQVVQALQPRTILRAPTISGLQVCWTSDDKQGLGVLLDAGNEGLAARVDATFSDALIPGSLVQNVCILRQGEIVLAPSAGEIRYQRRANDERGNHLVVGIRFVVLAEPHRPAKVFHEPFRTLGLIGRALRSGSSFRLRRVDDPVSAGSTVRAFLRDATGEARKQLVISSAGSSWSVGEVVRLDFELLGQGYYGLASIMEKREQQLVLSIPTALSRQHRRRSLRFHSSPDKPFMVTFRSPLDGSTYLRPVLDLHAFGASFQVDSQTDILPRGLRVDDFRLITPDGAAHPCGAEVRDIRPIDASISKSRAHLNRCGIKFVNLPAAARKAIFDSYVSTLHPGIEDGGLVAFPEIWRSVSNTKAWYGDYPAGLGPHVEVLSKTHDLVARQDALAKTFVYRNEGKIIGHASGLRYYSRTWALHHLAVVPGFHREDYITGDLARLVIDYAETLDDLEFVRFIWHTQNRYPHRIGTLLARSLRMEGLTRLRFFNHLRAPAGMRPVNLHVREAGRADLEWLESYFRLNGDLVSQRGDDLSAQELRLETIANRFTEAGLFRRRTIFVVDGTSGPLAFALAEQASPGLHWGEFLNAFSFVVQNREAPGVNDALVALAAKCQNLYYEAGRPSVVALVPDEDLSLLACQGFTSKGRFAEFTFHHSIVRSWSALCSGLFERLSRRASRTEAES